MREIPVGVSGIYTQKVAPSDLANQFKDTALPPVFATPIGHQVTATATVTRVEGRRIWFDVSARDETENIGTGTHERMVIDLRRLGQKLEQKAR